MNGKDRLLITFGIIGIIAAALFTSFGRNLFYLNIPNLVLPDVSNSSDSLHSDTEWQGDQELLFPVTVTVDSVQSVIASLSRTNSYFQEISVELFWAEGSSVTQVSVWRNGNWIAAQQTLPSGLVRHDLVGETTRYYWYDNDRSWLSAPASEYSADLSQHIPTYEDVINLDPSSILDASYQLYDDLSTIYVETATDTGIQRFWVSTQTGLLVAAEVEVEGALIYRLSAVGALQVPCPNVEPFALPDGTTISELS